MKDEVLDYLSSRRLKFFLRRDMARISSIKVGGLAEIYVIPSSAEDFVGIIDFLINSRVPYCVSGGVSNTLFSEDLFCGVVISTLGMRRISRTDNLFFAECGVSTASLMSYAARLGFGGYEALWLIPGTVGGAVRGNAGAHGTEIADILEYADVYFPREHVLRRMGRAELGFSYRSSLIKSHGEAYVLSAAVRLLPSDYGEIIARRRGFLAKRTQSQPTRMPSLGSIFKRVGGVSAGYFIDRAGLKGLRVGGAEVSRKHAGFIVNAGGATGRDVLELIRTVEERVYSKFGIVLEREVEIIGKEV